MLNEYSGLNEEEAAWFEHMLELGVIVLEGMEGDEPVYTVNLEMAKEYAPELYEAEMAEQRERLHKLWLDGMIELDVQSLLEEEQLYILTEKGKKDFGIT